MPTFRRPVLLRRALDSLRLQTFEEWICEVHNDDPEDSSPGNLVASLGDPRIELHWHPQNLGAVATFNLFYRRHCEPYFSILEDDNLWDPEFLARMVAEMEAHPTIRLAWCNQKIWKELPDGSWKDTGSTVNSLEDEDLPRLIWFGGWPQIMGAVHAHGAMLARSAPNGTLATPLDWPLAAIEHFRERMTPHPLLYLPQPMAIFSKTLKTARSETRAEWVAAQSLLAASFIKHISSADELNDVVCFTRAKHPISTNILIFAAMIEVSCRGLLSHLAARDWWRFIRSTLRRPYVIWHVLCARRRYSEAWQLLDNATAQRFGERGQGDLVMRRWG